LPCASHRLTAMLGCIKYTDFSDWRLQRTSSVWGANKRLIGLISIDGLIHAEPYTEHELFCTYLGRQMVTQQLVGPTCHKHHTERCTLWLIRKLESPGTQVQGVLCRCGCATGPWHPVLGALCVANFLLVMIGGSDPHQLAPHTAAETAGGPRSSLTPMDDDTQPFTRCPTPGPNSHGKSGHLPRWQPLCSTPWVSLATS
jgi:hypothetical protein